MNHAIITSVRALLLSMILSTLAIANQLPTLGESSFGIVSLDEEHQLGTAWVRTLRAQAPLLDRR